MMLLVTSTPSARMLLPAMLTVMLTGLLAIAGCGHAPGSHRDPAGTSPTPSLNDGNGSAVPPLPDLSNFPTPTIHRGGAVITGRMLGADVSWPQCPKGMGIPQKRSEGLPMPPPQARFVVIGLTNGPSFVPNPCIAAQVAWVRQRHLLAAAYSVVSYPDRQTLAALGGKGPYDASARLGRLSNVGYQAALFNVATMRRAGLRTPIVWLDVEPVPDFAWSSHLRANAAVLTGAARGYRTAGYRVGAYSTPAMWRSVAGGLRLGVPEWRPSGSPEIGDATARCTSAAWSFTGGSGVIGQWLEAGRDLDVTCVPRMRVDTWFHRY